MYYIAFNMRDPVLGKNKYLRQALSLAYDSDLYNQIYLNGRAINAQGPLPPGVFGYDPAFRNPYKTHDLEKARELLAKAGYPGGIDSRTGKRLELTYDIGSDSTRAREAATFDMRCFEQLGIEMKLQVNTFSQYLERTIKGTFQMTSAGWLADYPDPENFLQLLYGPNKPPNPNHVVILRPRIRPAVRTDKDDGRHAGKAGVDPQDGGDRRRGVPLDIQRPYPLLRAAPLVVQERQNHSISGNYRKYLRIDADARRAYWKAENKPDYKIAVYGLMRALRALAARRRRQIQKEEKVEWLTISCAGSCSPSPPCWASASSRSCFSTYSPLPRRSRENSSGRTPPPHRCRRGSASHGMDKPMFFNFQRGRDSAVHPFDSRFWNHMRELVLFQFPESDYLHEKVSSLLKEKIVPSLTITVPAFLLSILITLPLALFIAYYRGTYLDRTALFICVILMSIVILNYIIFGQYLLGIVLKYFPIYGYEFGLGAWRFVLLPVILAVASGLGGGLRFYRTVMLNEVRADYVRTAMAKGVSEENDPLQARAQERHDPYPDGRRCSPYRS